MKSYGATAQRLPVNELTDYEIGKLLLNYLQLLHSEGGVSLGRSPQSTMLESALRLLPQPELPYLGVYKPLELLEESTRRIESATADSGSEQLSLFPDDLRFISDYSLVHVILKKLQRWYKKDAKRYDRLPLIESRIVDAAVLLIKPDSLDNRAFVRVYSMEALYREERDRNHYRWHSGWRQRPYGCYD